MLFSFSACKKIELSPNTTKTFEIESDSITFAIIGDFGQAGEPARKVSEMVKSWDVDFIVTMGDNNYGDGELSTIKENISQYYCDFIYNPDAPDELVCTGAAASEQLNRFFPTLGNHDAYNSQNIEPYLAYFTLPGKEVYYDFKWGPVHFFSIYSGKNGEAVCCESEQAVWLKEQLNQSESPFKVVYFHHPPYSNAKHGSTETMQWPFKEWGATAVFSGHEHTYQRIMEINDLSFPYFINGLGGRSSRYNCDENPLDTNMFESFCYNENYGAMKGTATYAQMRLAFYSMDTSSNLIDEFILED